MSSRYPRPCATHKPTLEELQSTSFSDYIRKVVLETARVKFEDEADDDDEKEESSPEDSEDQPLYPEKPPLYSEGMAKIQMPDGFWQEEGIAKDRSGRGQAWQAGTPLGDLMIENPIKQCILGVAGVYEYNLFDTPALPLHEFREKADKYRENQIGTRDLSMEEMERKFWRRLGPTMEPPIYGADMEGSLFGSDPATGWNLGKLETLLQLLGPDLPGVTSPYLYLGMWSSVFCVHTEDVNLLSINYMHAGAPKIWYAVAPGNDSRRLEALAAFHYAHSQGDCKEFLRHKRSLLSPTILKKNGIPYTTQIQRPGDAMVTFPGGYHFGFNAGFNVAEATNFAVPEWFPSGFEARVCMCRPDSVRIEMYKLGELYKQYAQSQRSMTCREWAQMEEDKKNRRKLSKKRTREGDDANDNIDCSPNSNGTSATKTSDVKRTKQRKKQFWVEVVQPVATASLNAQSNPKNGGKKSKKRKRSKSSPNSKGRGTDDDEEIWHLAKPLSRKAIQHHARVLCMIPGSAIRESPLDLLGGKNRHDDETEEEGEQCFAGVIVEVLEGSARIHFEGLPKSDDVWMAVDSPKLYMDGGRWSEEVGAKALPAKHYWQEVDSTKIC